GRIDIGARQPVAVGGNRPEFQLAITAQLSGEEAIFLLADAGSQTLIRDTAGDDALYVLMPMRV
ncbi:DNA polymerase III subunit beta, partial [Rhizobium ruizarguesonis]